MKSKLTASQMSLWVGQKLHPDAPLYNTAATYKISGVLDELLFKQAFQKLIDSTDAFRLSFYEENGVPFQQLQRTLRFELEVVNFQEQPGDNSLSDWLRARCQQKLNLSERVFDSVLLKVSEDTYLWYLNLHHLVTDGVSRKIVFNRMASLYAALLGKEEIELPETPSYLDYVNSEIEQENMPVEENNFWASKIEGLDQLPVFYGFRDQRDITQTTRIPLPLGKKRSEKLKELAMHPELRSWTAHLSLFNVLSGLMFIYMYRVSGQKKLTLGAPLHNRISRKYRDTVGYFIEIFPLFLEIGEQETFMSLLKRVKHASNDNLKHAVQDAVTQKISSSFNAVLNYIPTNFPDFNGLSTTSDWVFPGHMDGSHQMRCHVVDFDGTGELKLLLDLNHGTFDAELRQRAPQHFLKLMDAMLTDLDVALESPDISTEEEKQFILSGGELKPFPNPFYNEIRNTIKQYPHHPAMSIGEEIISYEELDRKSDLLALHLKQLGIGSDKRVALYNFRSTEYIISVLAVVKLGAAFVPIASDQPLERILYILDDAKCSLVLTGSGLSDKLKNQKTSVLELHPKFLDELSTDTQPIHLGNNIEDESIAYILYTSGSTGNPKGVLISYRALSNYLLWARDHYYRGAAFTFPFYTSIGFDLTISSLFLPFLSGGTLVIYKESGSGPDISLMNVIQENKVNAIKITPSHINLLQGRDLSSSKIRTMIVGGEDFKTIQAKSVHLALKGNVKIFNEYGPTEATVGCIVSQYNPIKDIAASVPIGKPITNMNAYVLDGHMNIVPRGVVGELYLSGEGLSKGYVNLPGLTNEKFRDNPFVPQTKMYGTGDLARVNQEGSLEYLGRIDEQVKLNGFRIELPDIEANLSSHPQIASAAVVILEEKEVVPESEIENCKECGLPSNFPNADFDENGVCHLCNSFKGYKEKTDRYFKTEEELRDLLTSKKGRSEYDCLSLLSGGKDSTYILAKLISMGLRVLAFTLDNGYISDQAKANIDRIVRKLGVDHMYGETSQMNKIFVDSLHRHANVCNGCFKTIYTLSTKVALEKNIPFVVTGLSRGQFFETRLTEELFWDETADTTEIDRTILEARKLYHQEEDAVKQLLDVSMFNDDSTFEKVEFVDFYRYSDVSLSEMLIVSQRKKQIG